MVLPLSRPWSETMVSIPPLSPENPRNKGLLGLERPFSQTPRPRGRGRVYRPLLAEIKSELLNRFGTDGALPDAPE